MRPIASLLNASLAAPERTISVAVSVSPRLTKSAYTPLNTLDPMGDNHYVFSHSWANYPSLNQ